MRSPVGVKFQPVNEIGTHSEFHWFVALIPIWKDYKDRRIVFRITYHTYTSWMILRFCLLIVDVRQVIDLHSLIFNGLLQSDLQWAIASWNTQSIAILCSTPASEVVLAWIFTTHNLQHVCWRDLRRKKIQIKNIILNRYIYQNFILFTEYEKVENPPMWRKDSHCLPLNGPGLDSLQGRIFYFSLGAEPQLLVSATENSWFKYQIPIINRLLLTAIRPSDGDIKPIDPLDSKLFPALGFSSHFYLICYITIKSCIHHRHLHLLADTHHPKMWPNEMVEKYKMKDSIYLHKLNKCIQTIKFSSLKPTQYIWLWNYILLLKLTEITVS